LKVLLVSHADVHGGASMAALRLYRALLSAGAQVEFLVGKRHTDEPGVIGPTGGLRHRLSDLRSWVTVPLQWLHGSPNDSLHSYNLLPSGLDRQINAMAVDLVNIHWPHRELLSVAELGRIRQPMVWTLHDMWAFSGAAHYDDLDHPRRYRTGYREADRAGSRWDLDRWTWLRKQRHWQGADLAFVGPSRWMTGCVRSSALLGDRPAVTIPNCLDLELFSPVDRSTARQALGLPAGRRYLLCVALSITSDRRKGLAQMQPAIQQLAGRQDLELLIVGADRPAEPLDFGIPSRYLGAVRDEAAMAAIYAAADAFVAPSLQDNLPNTVVESLACGTPVVAYDVGGLGDLVNHGANGALARPFEIDDLATNLAWVLDHPRPAELAAAARGSMESLVAPPDVAARYLEFFESRLA
jgi:glycosyltransferase involved in cell wall biosynthesis